MHLMLCLLIGCSFLIYGEKYQEEGHESFLIQLLIIRSASSSTGK